MCERNSDDYSDCCSECDMDECMDYGTDTTLFSNSDYTDEEAINTRDVTDSREMQKLEDKKENCGHYISGCKIVAKCCNKEFGCRLCHDFETPDHEINRYEIEDIICNNCRLRQPVSNSCINKECSLFGGSLHRIIAIYVIYILIIQFRRFTTAKSVTYAGCVISGKNQATSFTAINAEDVLIRNLKTHINV